MTPYSLFKKLLIENLLKYPVYKVAFFAMQDYKIPCKHGNGSLDYKKIIAFIDSLKMPYGNINASSSYYVARFYPKVYEAFLNGASNRVLYAMILKTKAHIPKVTAKERAELKERSIDKTRYTIKARSLSKNHDWNTVK